MDCLENQSFTPGSSEGSRSGTRRKRAEATCPWYWKFLLALMANAVVADANGAYNRESRECRPRSLDLISGSKLDDQFMDDVAVILQWLPVGIPGSSHQLPENRNSRCGHNDGIDHHVAPSRGGHAAWQQHNPDPARELGSMVEMARRGGMPGSDNKYIIGVSYSRWPNRRYDNLGTDLPSIKNIRMVQESRTIEHGQVWEEEPVGHPIDTAPNERRKEWKPGRWESELKYGESNSTNAGVGIEPRGVKPKPRLGWMEVRVE